MAHVAAGVGAKKVQEFCLSWLFLRYPPGRELCNKREMPSFCRPQHYPGQVDLYESLRCTVVSEERRLDACLRYSSVLVRGTPQKGGQLVSFGRVGTATPGVVFLWFSVICGTSWVMEILGWHSRCALHKNVLGSNLLFLFSLRWFLVVVVVVVVIP